jgi:hypothetical protein
MTSYKIVNGKAVLMENGSPLLYNDGQPHRMSNGDNYVYLQGRAYEVHKNKKGSDVFLLNNGGAYKINPKTGLPFADPGPMANVSAEYKFWFKGPSKYDKINNVNPPVAPPQGLGTPNALPQSGDSWADKIKQKLESIYASFGLTVGPYSALIVGLVGFLILFLVGVLLSVLLA